MTHLPDLETQFVRAARTLAASRVKARRRHRLLALSAAGALLASSAALAASGGLGLGDPSGTDERPSPARPIGDARPTGIVVQDPSGGPDWTLARFSSQDGAPCFTVARTDGTRLGHLDENGRFRSLPEGETPFTCGTDLARQRIQRLERRAAAGGAGECDAQRCGDTPRVLRYGFLGEDAESAWLEAPDGTRHAVAVDASGGFLIVQPGTEPRGLLHVRYSDGAVASGSLDLGGPHAFRARPAG